MKEKLLCESAVCPCQLQRCIKCGSWERGEQRSPRVKRREFCGFSRIPFHLNRSKVIKANGAIVPPEKIQWLYSEQTSLRLCVCVSEIERIDTCSFCARKRRECCDRGGITVIWSACVCIISVAAVNIAIVITTRACHGAVNANGLLWQMPCSAVSVQSD